METTLLEELLSSPLFKSWRKKSGYQYIGKIYSVSEAWVELISDISIA
jgi:hypothetical protein